MREKILGKKARGGGTKMAGSGRPSRSKSGKRRK
jgi:hypothetical protein